MDKITAFSLRAALLLLLPLAAGCGGEGAGCLSPTDFPSEQRIPNAVQLRLGQPAFDRLGADVKKLIEAAFGGTRLGFEPQCEGNVRVCCGLPADTCGITLDLDERPGGPPRLAFTPLSDGRQGLSVTFNTRIFTERTLDVDIQIIQTSNCEVDIDTARGATPDVTIGATLLLETDPMTGTTRVGVDDLVIAGIESADIDSRGGGQCGNVSSRLDDIQEGLRDALAEQAPKLVELPLCASCASEADCGVGTCNTERGVCEVPGAGDDDPPRCIQQLGTVGRFPAGELFGQLAAAAPLDLYLVSSTANALAGGLSFSADSGIYLPVASGLAPSTPSCAPAAPAPDLPPGGIELSEMMGANSLDDLGEFDFAIAIHKAFLDRAGWAFHQAGLFCATIDGSSYEQLSVDSLALLFPSLVDLVDGGETPIAIRLRPQKPPTFAMNRQAAALVVELKDFEVDFFVTIRERSVRLFSTLSDVAVPINLGAGADGAIVPLIGDLASAFTNVRVTNPGLLAEPDDEVAAKFEALGGLSLNMLVGSIGSFELPALPYLRPSVIEKGLRGLDGGDFLGLFGKLEVGAATGMPLAPRERFASSTAELVAVHLPDASAYAESTLDRSKQPSIELALGGVGPGGGALEWQVRLDGGAWSSFSRDPRLVLSRLELWVPLKHVLEVRARLQDRPESTDPTPTKLLVDLRPSGRALAGRAASDDEAASSSLDPPGAGCASSASARGAAWLVLGLLSCLWLLARRARPAAGCLLVIALSASQPACLIGAENISEKGPAYGRWSDVASDGVRAVASSYEAREGNLVLGTVVASGVKAFEIVDDDGDVGAWSSVVLVGGYARIAYQDRSRGRLKFAIETSRGFTTHVVDQSDGVAIGRYAKLAVRPGGGFGVAYLAEEPRDGGGAATQLRFAETASDSPDSDSWSRELLPFARAETTESSPLDAVPLGSGLYGQLAYTAAGDPIVAFCDTSAPALIIGRRVGDAWTSAVLDEDADTGPCAFAALAIGADDAVHIAYQTTIANDLRYVHLGPDEMSGAIAIVDDGRRAAGQHPVGGSAQIILDDAGRPIIVYQDGYSLELRRADLASGEWRHQVAAGGAAALGFSISMAWFKDQLIISAGAIDRGKRQAHQVTTTIVK